MNNKDCKVAIISLTYNHEPFIRNCLDGFVMQKTNFPFVAIVHDDASTDKTASILKEYAEKYPDIIDPIFEEENQYTKADSQTGKKIETELNKYKPKYIALCEGDDYWIEPNKLQKQVDEMEADEEISLCYTRSKCFNTSRNEFTIVRGLDCVDFRTFLLYDETITLTVLIKYELYKKYFEVIQPQNKNWLMGDTPLWLWLAKNGKIKPIDIISGIYNAHEGSASRTGSYKQHQRFNKSALDIRLFFIEKYDDCRDLIPYLYDKYYRKNMGDAYGFLKVAECLKNFKCLNTKEKDDYKVVFKLFPRVLLYIFHEIMKR